VAAQAAALAAGSRPVAAARAAALGSSSGGGGSSSGGSSSDGSFVIVGDLVVVTGRGKHSGEDGPKLHAVAEQALRALGLVDLLPWPRNPGRFWVSEGSLARWAAASETNSDDGQRR
jgi:hypothetical protein